MLDLFCGRFGWGKAFAQRGWEVVGIDLIEPPEVPVGCTFIKADILNLRYSGDFASNNWFIVEDGRRYFIGDFDAVCCSSPCEQFTLFRMRNFHPNPPYPSLGIQLFNHARELCEQWGGQYVMENVAGAQDFIGNAAHHAGPFYLWGNAVPMLMPKGITKGFDLGSSKATKGMSRTEISAYRKKFDQMWSSSKSAKRKQQTAEAATIPLELSSTVCDYMERVLEQRRTA